MGEILSAPAQAADGRLRKAGRWARGRWSGPSSTERAALAATIQAREEVLRKLTPGSADWSEKLNAITEEARGTDVSTDTRWALVNLVDRANVAGLTAQALHAKRAAVRDEAKSKLHGWRRATVENLLADTPNATLDERRSLLREAMAIRDEGNANVHRKGVLLARTLTRFGVILFVLLSLLLGLLLAYPPDLGANIELGQPRVWLYAFLFGAVGGTLSAIQRTSTRDGRTRVPEMLEQGILAGVLPLTGAAAALALYPLAAGNLLPEPVDTVGAFLGVAAAAGASERLFVRAAQQFDKG